MDGHCQGFRGNDDEALRVDIQFELTHLIDALPGLAWTALPDGRAELLNRRWLDYTGLTAEQAFALACVEFWSRCSPTRRVAWLMCTE